MWVYEIAIVEDRELAVVTTDRGAKVFDVSVPRRRRELEKEIAKLKDENAPGLSRNPDVLLKQAELFALEGIWGRASQLFEQARQSGADVSSLALARCYWKTDKYDLASAEFQKALQWKEAPAFYLELCIKAVKRQSAQFN